ncbi:phytanoyl-CoA dioxygenase family protein [Actinopolymorpha alba]|uniref:phytanoyl-CoA dioxygenase family protein n=1 Tax=Actinopolymorpha alba TaxID=533267 RepID=UPI00035D5C3E|nr:phytanoyl-CoA dioxygenase family protein [Actinopolymorpha alba]
MPAITFPELRAQGSPLDASPAALGPLRRSEGTDVDPVELRQRVTEDGYLYLPGMLDRSAVLAARQDVLCRLAAVDGALAADTDPEAGIPGSRPATRILSDLALASPPLQRVLYDGRLPAFYTHFFGENVRHFDFTWLRAVYPGTGTLPHGDSVFMNRGTPHLMTVWIPLGDVSFDLGGLMILEKSHRLDNIRREYGSRDVDTYCASDDESANENAGWTGYISENPAQLQRELGLRWLTGEFTAGDVVTFPIHTLHASLDNTSACIRLSADIRYQPASEPADPRWIGPEPTAHGPLSKQAMIC